MIEHRTSGSVAPLSDYFAALPGGQRSAVEERFLFGHSAPVVENAVPRFAAARQHSLAPVLAEPHSRGLQVAVAFPDFAAYRWDELPHSPSAWPVAVLQVFRYARSRSDAVRTTALEVSDCESPPPGGSLLLLAA